MKTYFVAAAAALAFAVPAQASDFNGAYLGAGVTLDNVQGSGSLEGFPGVNGVGGTVFAGYDLPVSAGLFVGAEANFDLSSADIGSFNADQAWGVSGRFGGKLSDKTAAYARVGYAQSRLKVPGDHTWLEGVRYGAGLETDLSDKLSLRGELSQINLENDFINNQVQVAVAYRF